MLRRLFDDPVDRRAADAETPGDLGCIASVEEREDRHRELVTLRGAPAGYVNLLALELLAHGALGLREVGAGDLGEFGE